MRLFGRPKTYIITALTSECEPKQNTASKRKGSLSSFFKPDLRPRCYDHRSRSMIILILRPARACSRRIQNILLLEFQTTATLLHLSLPITRGLGVATKPHKMSNLVLTHPTLGVGLFGSNVSRAFDLIKCRTTGWSGTFTGVFFLGLTHRNVGWIARTNVLKSRLGR